MSPSRNEKNVLINVGSFNTLDPEDWNVERQET